jgi:hypothetical protein
VAEWFCRWSHSERVFLHLERVEGELKWDGIPFRKQLGDLCRSHNLDAVQLKQDDLCPTDLLVVADVRFCAILLRLADIRAHRKQYTVTWALSGGWTRAKGPATSNGSSTWIQWASPSPA